MVCKCCLHNTPSYKKINTKLKKQHCRDMHKHSVNLHSMEQMSAEFFFYHVPMIITVNII